MPEQFILSFVLIIKTMNYEVQKETNQGKRYR